MDTHAITREQADKAKATPLKLAPPNVEASDAPYFVDMVRDHADQQVQRERVERPVLPHLHDARSGLAEGRCAGGRDRHQAGGRAGQKDANQAHQGRQESMRQRCMPGPQAQVALVALDPHTGAVLALVGGRNYGWSQLNHAVAKRPTGSIFKPFVYAAAMNTALDGSPPVIHARFDRDGCAYELRVWRSDLRAAQLQRGISRRRDAALRAGHVVEQRDGESCGGSRIRQSGGPGEVGGNHVGESDASDGAGIVRCVAAGYGWRVHGIREWWNAAVADHAALSAQCERRCRSRTTTRIKSTVLDPRIAYVMTNMMEGVINNGLGYTAVRLRGFTPPAAGKTGSSHDGWFAGYTSNLLCIVWVGYDDYSDLRLSGAQTAAPIWAEFMKKAAALPQYSDDEAFSAAFGRGGRATG